MSDKDHLSGFTNKPNASSIPASYGARLKAWWDPDVSFTNVKQAASFTAANTEYLSVASNSTLQITTNDAWGVISFYMDTKPGSNMALFCKYIALTNQRELIVSWSSSLDRLRFSAYGNGTATPTATVDANTFGAPSATTPYFLMWYHDAANNQIGISVNGGAFDTASYSGDFFAGSAPLTIGSLDGASQFWNGRIDEVAFGKSPPGGIAALATTIRDALYNGGDPIGVRDISAAQRTAWGGVSAWPLNEASGTRSDIWGSNHLTDNNTVTSADGLATGPAANGESVYSLTERDSSLVFSQSDTAKRPAYDTVTDADGYLDFDGTNDLLAHTSADPITTATAGEFHGVFRPDSVAGTQTIFASCDESVANKYFCIQLNAGFLEVACNNGGTEDRVTATSSVLAVGSAAVLSVISDGNAWTLKVNNVTQSLSVASGSNSGAWLGDVSGRDSATLGARKTTSESNFLNGKLGECFLIDA